MLRLATSLALVLASLPAAASREPVDCRSELATAQRLLEGQRSRRLQLADPLARAVRQAIERLGDADRAVVARFTRGEATAAEVDRALWPKLFPAIDRFNRAGCGALGGVVHAEEIVEASTALGGGKGLHTGVLVACARRPMQLGEERRYLGLRVRQGEQGPVIALYGFLQERESPFAAPGGSFGGLVVEVPLGDRRAEHDALNRAVAAFTGSAGDFDWTVPADCRPRVTLAR
jgi:hypothetical protein